MKKFKIGVQLYSVRGDMEKDFEGTLAKVAARGYEYVEFAGYYGKSSEEIKALLDKYNLKCISVHQGVEFFDTHIDESQYNSFYQLWSTVTPIYMDGEEIRP